MSLPSYVFSRLLSHESLCLPAVFHLYFKHFTAIILPRCNGATAAALNGIETNMGFSDFKKTCATISSDGGGAAVQMQGGTDLIPIGINQCAK